MREAREWLAALGSVGGLWLLCWALISLVNGPAANEHAELRRVLGAGVLAGWIAAPVALVALMRGRVGR